MLNEVKQCGTVTIETLKLIGYSHPLDPAITSILKNKKQYVGYIIGSTLFNKKFNYDNTIKFGLYLKLYAENDQMYNYMKLNKEFLKRIYEYGYFDSSLSIEKLKVISDTCGYSVKLIGAIFKACKTDEERINYFLEIDGLSNSDANCLTDLICSKEYKHLLKNNEYKINAIRLTRMASNGIKSYLSRVINEVNIVKDVS